MPVPPTVKPLFRADALRPKLAGFAPPPAAVAARAALARWADHLRTPAGLAQKETELLPGFVRDVFEGVLGYAGPPAARQTLKREGPVDVGGKFADAGLGRFWGDGGGYAAVVEGKGPRDPLDRPFAGRKASAVDQALKYAVELRIDWYLVTSLVETRLYHKGHDTLTYERFDLGLLAKDDAAFARFVFLLGADRVVPAAGGPNHLDGLLADSRRERRELTDEFYREYRFLRESTLRLLRAANPSADPAGLLAATQKLLDRVLFIAFAEDRGLMPADLIAKAYAQANPFDPRPVWDNFRGLFRSVDKGNPALGIGAYNGGLFAPDPVLDALAVPDAVCERFKDLAEYDYGDPSAAAGRAVDVEILGHIFEQSIADLEALQKSLAAPAGGVPAEAAAPGRRKRDGAFYTPASVTRYVVRETLGPVLAGRFAALRNRHEADAPRADRAALADPPGVRRGQARRRAAAGAGEVLGGVAGRTRDRACP